MYKVGAQSIAQSPKQPLLGKSEKELFEATNPKKSTLHLSKEFFNKQTPPHDDQDKISNPLQSDG